MNSRDTPEPVGEESLWTSADVARYLKLSRGWVYRAVRDGRLPHRRVAGRLRFVPAEIRALQDPEEPRGAVVPLAPQRK